MNYKDLQKRYEWVSCLMADIEDSSLLMESMELNEEEVKVFLLDRCHDFLWEEYKDTEDQLERLDLAFKKMEEEDAKIETWTMVKDSD